MRIGVISDTHLYHRAAPLPGIVLDIFDGVDHIIHGGDIVGTDVIPALEWLAPVTAVAGNLDTAEVRARYGEKKVLRIGGFAIGICHGHGKRGRTLDRALSCFAGERPDCVVFGHSHIPYTGYHEGVLYLNPGSPTDKRRNQYYSVGLIELNGEMMTRVIYFDREGTVRN